MAEHPMNGRPVRAACIFCKKRALPEDRYGTGPKDWDYTDICPECWPDEMFEEE